MLYKSNNQTEHIVTEKVKKKEIKAKEREERASELSEPRTPNIHFKYNYAKRKICSNDNFLSEVLLPKVAAMGDTGALLLLVMLQRSPQWRNEVSPLHIFIVYSLLSPLKSFLNLSNHYNTFNVFIHFLAKCAMFYFYIHCKMYINVIVLHFTFCFFLFLLSTMFLRSTLLPCAH